MVSQITPLPPAPQRTDAPADFVTKADAHVASLTQFVTETNTLATEVNQLADDAESSANASAASESVATASANFKGEWSSLTGALNIPASVAHNGSFWVLLNNLADVTLSEPSVTIDWQSTIETSWINQSSNFTMVAGQRYNVDGSGGAIDISEPVIINEGDFFSIHNESISTSIVRILNSGTSREIRGAAGTITNSDNLIVGAGETVYIVAKSNTILEVV